MANKKKQSKKPQKAKGGGAPPPKEKEEDDPPKEKEEDEIIVKNGKSYRVRKQLPDVGYVLKYGIPGKEGQRDPSKKWYQELYLPGLLFLVFVVSLGMFHLCQPYLGPRVRKASMQDIRDRKARMAQMQQQKQKPGDREL